jgi:hypothetical protein
MWHLKNYSQGKQLGDQQTDLLLTFVTAEFAAYLTVPDERSSRKSSETR